MTRQGTILLIILGSILSASADILLVSERFIGDATDLQGTPADVYHPALLTAGGTGLWSAYTSYNTDGEVQSHGQNSSALLNMGSYLNDAKGTPNAIFTLQGTIEHFNTNSSDNWMSMGFYQSGASISEAFYTTNKGVGTAVFRYVDGGSDYYAGPGTANGFNAGNLVADGLVQTFTIRLDLSTHDGSSDFGNIAFYRNGGATPEFTHSYTTDLDFRIIGFSDQNDEVGRLSAFTLTQVPEPGTLGLVAGGFALVLMLNYRRSR